MLGSRLRESRRLKARLFQTLDKAHKDTGEAINRRSMLRAVKERCIAARLSRISLTTHFAVQEVFLNNGGSLEAAQDMAYHSGPPPTKLYDRRKELANLSEIAWKDCV